MSQWGQQPAPRGSWPAPGQQQWQAPGRQWNAPRPTQQWGSPVGQWNAPRPTQQWGSPVGQPWGTQVAQRQGPGQVWQPPAGQPGRRISPLAWLIIAILAILAGIVVAGLLTNQGTDNQPSQYQNEDYRVPEVDTAPDKPPVPETYEQATDWMQKNPIYGVQVPAPTRCGSPPIDLGSASKGELEAHYNELTACLMRVWDVSLQQAGFTLPRPSVTIYESAVSSRCGELPMENAVYCGADQQIYVATDLPEAIPAAQRATPYSAEAVVAHEFAHHIQMRTGILISTIAWEKQSTEAAANDFNRRLELQADCWAGMFMGSAGPSVEITEARIRDISQVFYQFGDDVITGDPNYDGNHGHGSNRRNWFLDGSANVVMGTCNTYTAPDGKVR